MKPLEQKILVLGTLSIFFVVMLSFVLLRPYFWVAKENVVSENTPEETIGDLSSFNIYKEGSDLSDYKKIIYFAGAGFENIQNGSLGGIYDKALLDGSQVCMYTSDVTVDQAIDDVNKKHFDALIYYEGIENDEQKNLSIQIYYDNRFAIPDYDSQNLAKDIGKDAIEFLDEKKISCDVNLYFSKNTTLAQARVPAVYVKLEGPLHKNKGLKDDLATELLKTICKIMIQKERGQ